MTFKELKEGDVVYFLDNTWDTEIHTDKVVEIKHIKNPLHKFHMGIAIEPSCTSFEVYGDIEKAESSSWESVNGNFSIFLNYEDAVKEHDRRIKDIINGLYANIRYSESYIEKLTKMLINK